MLRDAVLSSGKQHATENDTTTWFIAFDRADAKHMQSLRQHAADVASGLEG